MYSLARKSVGDVCASKTDQMVMSVVSRRECLCMEDVDPAQSKIGGGRCC